MGLGIFGEREGKGGYLRRGSETEGVFLQFLALYSWVVLCRCFGRADVAGLLLFAVGFLPNATDCRFKNFQDPTHKDYN